MKELVEKKTKQNSQQLGETKDSKEEDLSRGVAFTAFLAHLSSAPQFSISHYELK